MTYLNKPKLIRLSLFIAYYTRKVMATYHIESPTQH